jgi:hypothetical protein
MVFDDDSAGDTLMDDAKKDIVSFVVKVLVLSALLSGVIKYGGPLLPFVAPFTEQLNGLVTLVVVLPSILIGVVLVVLLKRSPQPPPS